MNSKDLMPETPKKKNKLEKTQWKATANSSTDSDVLLDFYTEKDVYEYVTLPTGKEIQSRVGTYKLFKSGYLKIKWGKLKRDQVDGYIRGQELSINELLKTRKYYKVKEY